LREGYKEACKEGKSQRKKVKVFSMKEKEGEGKAHTGKLSYRNIGKDYAPFYYLSSKVGMDAHKHHRKQKAV